MMVAKGYMTIDGTNYVTILDPWGTCTGDERIITYEAYRDGETEEVDGHWNDYYDIGYVGGGS